MVDPHKHEPKADYHCRICEQPLIEIEQNRWVTLDKWEEIQAEEEEEARMEAAHAWDPDPAPPRE